MNTEGEKRPVAIQIFGSDKESLAYSAKYISNIADIVDFNLGCPAPKVVKNGDGSKLLTDLEKAKEMIETICKNSKVPVTVKIRIGWDKEHIVATEIAKVAEEAGAQAITVHGRTRSEFYSGKSDLDIIRKVKEAVNIPVIGNGDIVDEESAKEMFEKTNVDGIMIGRASLGNPWIFKRIINYLKTGEKLEEITPSEKLRVIRKHLDLEIKEKGEEIAIKEFRKHIGAYSKGLSNSSEFRTKVNKLENKLELENAINTYFSSLEGGNLYV